jgi:hypothetical protein
MATVKPMQAWALEQQMERQRENRPVATETLLPVAAAMPKFRENTTEPIHNWAASDARGAEFAQRGELQRRDYEQRGKLQDKEFGQQKEMLDYRMQLQQKYAPKKRAGGLGPIAKDMQEYIKIASGAPPADERQATANQARLKIIAARLARGGTSGRNALSELERVGLMPDFYKTAANKRLYEKENIAAKGEGQSETATLRAQTAKEIAALRALGSDPSLRPPKDTLLEDAKVTAERAARQQQFRDMATGIMEGGGKKVRAKVQRNGKTVTIYTDGSMEEE